MEAFQVYDRQVMLLLKTPDLRARVLPHMLAFFRTVTTCDYYHEILGLLASLRSELASRRILPPLLILELPACLQEVQDLQGECDVPLHIIAITTKDWVDTVKDRQPDLLAFPKDALLRWDASEDYLAIQMRSTITTLQRMQLYLWVPYNQQTSADY